MKKISKNYIVKMNHQFWVIKNAKKIQRKFNGKEDENIVAR